MKKIALVVLATALFISPATAVDVVEDFFSFDEDYMLASAEGDCAPIPELGVYCPVTQRVSYRESEDGSRHAIFAMEDWFLFVGQAGDSLTYTNEHGGLDTIQFLSAH